MMQSMNVTALRQPPSGGCVLKQSDIIAMNINDDPAAFGRLCVETTYNLPDARGEFPAAFGRLCVETVPMTKLYL